MKEHPDVRADHPDELLAAYVDDTASSPERSAVEQHLAECAACREDVVHARRARGALRALPQIASPGFVDAVLEVAEGSAPAPRAGGRSAIRRSEERWGRRWRAAWGAGLAAAAVLAGVVVYVGMGDGGSNGDTAAPATEATPAAGAPADHTSQSVDRLARALAEDVGAMGRTSAEDTLEEPAADAGEGFQGTDGASCVLSAAGASARDTTMVHLEEGTFQGMPAHIGGFIQPGPAPQLIVAVASLQDCTPLYVAAVPL